MSHLLFLDCRLPLVWRLALQKEILTADLGQSWEAWADWPPLVPGDVEACDGVGFDRGAE